MIYLWTWF